MLETIDTLRKKPQSTKSVIAFSVSLVLTLAFAVPWFYYRYIQDKPEVSIKDTTVTAQISGSFGAPIGKIIKETKDTVFNFIGEMLKGEDNYSNEVLK